MWAVLIWVDGCVAMYQIGIVCNEQKRRLRTTDLDHFNHIQEQHECILIFPVMIVSVCCVGLFIFNCGSLVFKLFLVSIPTFPQPRATMPRVFVFRAVVLFLVFVLTFAFWLFYGVRIVKEKQGTYEVSWFLSFVLLYIESRDIIINVFMCSLEKFDQLKNISSLKT